MRGRARFTAACVRLASLAVVLGLALAGAAGVAHAQTFPSSSEWTPMLRGGVALGDPTGDAQGGGSGSERDVVGDSSNPAIYTAVKNGYFFVRIRVNGNPYKNNGFEPFGWGCLLDTDQDPGDYEFMMMLDGINNPDSVEYRWNSNQGARNDWTDSADTVVASYAATTHARSSTASSTFSNNADYFVDFTVPVSIMTTPGGGAPSMPLGTAFRIACGTSSNAQSMAADPAAPANATTLTEIFSDPQTCSGTGCTTCNLATACGSSCTACSGGTPACNGSTGTCVRCVASSDCPTGASCSGNACVLPAPTVTSPANGAVTNVTTPTVTGTTAANASVTVSVDGSSIGSTTASAGGVWSLMVPMALSYGTHTVSAVASVGSGALAVTSAASATNTFQIISGCLADGDCSGSTPKCQVGSGNCVRCLATSDCPTGATCSTGSCVVPTPVVTAPTNGTVTNVVRPSISGTSAASATVTVTIDGVVAGTTTASAGGAWSFSPTSDLSVASHTVTVTATLGAGALAVTSGPSAGVTFEVVSGCLADGDCSGGTPRCETASRACVRCLVNGDCPAGALCASNACVLSAPVVTAPANGSITNVTSPTISGTAAANATVVVSVDGGSIGTATASAGGDWSLPVPMALSFGTHTVSATASVGSGALAVTSATSATNTFQVISGCLSDGDCGGASPKCLVASNNCVRCLATGDCPTGATCTGNACVVPAPAVTSPANASITNVRRPAIAGTSVANATVTISVDGAVVGTATAGAGGTWSYEPTSDLSVASHTVSATATLGAGAQAVTSASSAAITFEVVTGCLANGDCGGSVPVCETTSRACVRCLVTADCPSGATCAANACAVDAPVITTPVSGSTINVTTPSISGTATPGATVTITLDGAVVGTALASPGGAWSFSPAMALGVGSHTLTAVATLGSGLLAVSSPVSATTTFQLISGCLADPDCGGGAPRCLLASNTCVRCLADMDCPAGAAC